ncbi:MAG: T9SS type A sorting domain-containing protein, partial [Candidatus Symbiothrix sp.]|nr:T9SS type A sorting domain-containing protein [Candidatus Symbiothrix sp.]
LYVPAASVEIYRTTAVWEDFKEIKAYVPAAIEAPAAESSIRLYPNPVAESFCIDGITVPTQVRVTDFRGCTVWTQTVAGNEPVAVGHLPQGVYLVQVNGKTVKVIKR